MCPLVKEFQKHPTEFETIVCVTGPHREMLDQVLKIFEVKPDYDLNIMKQGQDLYDVTARVLAGMRYEWGGKAQERHLENVVFGNEDNNICLYPVLAVAA